jgi:hypothetical protein
MNVEQSQNACQTTFVLKSLLIHMIDLCETFEGVLLA